MCVFTSWQIEFERPKESCLKLATYIVTQSITLFLFFFELLQFYSIQKYWHQSSTIQQTEIYSKHVAIHPHGSSMEGVNHLPSLPQSWFSGKWLLFQGTSYWRYTHFPFPKHPNFEEEYHLHPVSTERLENLTETDPKRTQAAGLAWLSSSDSPPSSPPPMELKSRMWEKSGRQERFLKASHVDL